MKIFFSYAHRDEDRVQSLINFLTDAGHEPLSVGNEYGSSFASSSVFSSIKSAELFIAVTSVQSSNVLFELGLASGMGIPSLIASYADLTIPIDAYSIPYIQMSGDISRDGPALLRSIARIERDIPARDAPAPSFAKDIEAVSFAEFEELIGATLAEKGFEVKLSQDGRDSGLDFIISAPGSSRPIAVEVKRVGKHGRVSVDAVRQLVGRMVYVRASNALLISDAGFTSSAMAFASETGVVALTMHELGAARSYRDILKKLER